MTDFGEFAPKELRFPMKNIVHFGLWSNGTSASMSNCFHRQPTCRGAFTIETAFANTYDTTMTPDLARAAGRTLAKAALREWMRDGREVKP